MVAILTGPGGSVLLVVAALDDVLRADELRSSPAPEGRCCSTSVGSADTVVRCCDPHRPRRVGAAGPEVLLVLRQRAVAILTGPGGSVLRRCWGVSLASLSCSCDPHRPRRVGAASLRR